MRYIGSTIIAAGLAFVGVAVADDGDDMIRVLCAKKWPEDYSMQVYCINQEVEAKQALFDLMDDFPAGTEPLLILMRCYTKWTEPVGKIEHRMVLYCYHQQLAAYESLRR